MAIRLRLPATQAVPGLSQILSRPPDREEVGSPSGRIGRERMSRRLPLPARYRRWQDRLRSPTAAAPPPQRHRLVATASAQTASDIPRYPETAFRAVGAGPLGGEACARAPRCRPPTEGSAERRWMGDTAPERIVQPAPGVNLRERPQRLGRHHPFGSGGEAPRKVPRRHPGARQRRLSGAASAGSGAPRTCRASSSNT